MQQKDWFTTWFNSPYYYQLQAKDHHQQLYQFLARVLEFIRPQPLSNILEVNCGTGNESKALAAAGYQVTGIDASCNAIEQASPLTADNLNFYEHDIRLPFRINYFDIAFNLLNKFGYYNTQRDHDNAVRTIAQSLRLNGYFILDYLNVHFEEDHLQPAEQLEIGATLYNITNTDNEQHFIRKIEIEDRLKGQHATFSDKRAKFSPGDITDMFAYQGLQVQEIFGDYNLTPFNIRQSPRMIVLGKKIRTL